MRQTRHQGIVLISVIFLTVLIGMYVVSSFTLSRGQLAVASQSQEDRLAEQAARSGIDYALSRLEENAEWRGDGNGLIVDSPSLIVREDNGNVVGLIRNSDGAISQFRLRFNYQDGGGGGDQMGDPAANMTFDTEHISVNNLGEPDERDFPLGDGTRITGYPIPAQSVGLVCEGRVAGDFDSFDSTNLNPSTSRLQAERTIEGIYRIKDLSGETPVEDAVSMAAQNLTVELFDGDGTNPAALLLSDASGADNPKVRSRGDIVVANEDGSDGSLNGVDGEVLLPNGNTLSADMATSVTRSDEDTNSGFYQLAWDGVPTQTSNVADLNAGVYVFWESDGQLHYYPENYESYRQKMVNDPTFVTDPGQTGNILPTGLEFVPAGNAGPDGVTSAKNRFVVTDDVRVVSPTAHTDVVDLTIIPRSGAKEDIVSSGGGGGQQGGGGNNQVPSGVSQLFPNITSNTTSNYAEHVHAGIQNAYNNQLFDGNTGQNVHQLISLLAPQGGTIINLSAPQENVVWTGNQQTQPSINGNGEHALTEFVKTNSGPVLMAPPGHVNQTFLEAVPGTSNQHWRLRADVLGAYISGNSFSAEAASSEDIDKFDLETLSGGSVPNEDIGPQDFEITFVPDDHDGIRMSGDGDFRLASDIRGSGASIKAEGQIRLVGMGFDIQANPGEEGPAISLYAKDDIVISTLQPDGNSGHAFTGLKLSGILYSWSNIELKSGSADEQSGVDPQLVHITGAMVAYGGDPASDDPGANGKGRIELSGDQIELEFDPGYLLGLADGSGFKVTLAPLSQSYR